MFSLLSLANSLEITSLIRTLLLQYCFNNTVDLIYFINTSSLT